MDDIALDGVRQGLCAGCRAAVDTGTSELAGPSSIVGRSFATAAICLRLSAGCSCCVLLLPIAYDRGLHA